MQKLFITTQRPAGFNIKNSFNFLKNPKPDTLNNLCIWTEFDSLFGTRVFYTVWPKGSGSKGLSERKMEAIKKFWVPLSTQALLNISDSHGVRK